MNTLAPAGMGSFSSGVVAWTGTSCQLMTSSLDIALPSAADDDGARGGADDGVGDDDGGRSGGSDRRVSACRAADGVELGAGGGRRRENGHIRRLLGGGDRHAGRAGGDG